MFEELRRERDLLKKVVVVINSSLHRYNADMEWQYIDEERYNADMVSEDYSKAYFVSQFRL